MIRRESNYWVEGSSLQITQTSSNNVHKNPNEYYWTRKRHHLVIKGERDTYWKSASSSAADYRGIGRFDKRPLPPLLTLPPPLELPLEPPHMLPRTGSFDTKGSFPVRFARPQRIPRGMRPAVAASVLPKTTVSASGAARTNTMIETRMETVANVPAWSEMSGNFER